MERAMTLGLCVGVYMRGVRVIVSTSTTTTTRRSVNYKPGILWYAFSI